MLRVDCFGILPKQGATRQDAGARVAGAGGCLQPCGGTLDEITFACNALGKKDSVLVSPGDYYRLLKGCGTIHDWR